MKKDYYEILGLEKSSTLPEIKKKYRSLALKYHPDRVEADEKAEAEAKFKEISEAYGVLSDNKKRTMYDQHGHAGIDQQFTSEDIFRGADFGDLGDIFSQFFGGGGGGGQDPRSQRGSDIQYEVNISLQEAHDGISKKISIPRNEHCKKCDGSGAKSASDMKTCGTCGGHGQVVMSSGFFRMKQACTDCSGRGKVITSYCPKCHGKGVNRITRTIDVTIPSGVDSNSRLRVTGEGEVGSGGSGDLYVYINVEAKKGFQRDGQDLYILQQINFVKAVLGGTVSIETLSGNVDMKIPQGTQSGKMFRLKGKGMPSLRGGHSGDQYVKVMIEVPTKLSKEERGKLEEYAVLAGEDFEPAKEGLKEKIKKVFT